MIRTFAPVIEKNGEGSILNILSVLSWINIDEGGGYSAVKSAQWGVTKALRLELVAKKR
ncbi:SDR family NAD(P)-dependent oxidoreductase [Paenibacillus sp. SER-28]